MWGSAPNVSYVWYAPRVRGHLAFPHLSIEAVEWAARLPWIMGMAHWCPQVGLIDFVRWARTALDQDGPRGGIETPRLATAVETAIVAREAKQGLRGRRQANRPLPHSLWAGGPWDEVGVPGE